MHVKYYFPASGRQCMRSVSSTLKPSACRHSLRAPKSSERNLRYKAIALPSLLPSGNWLLCQLNIADSCRSRSFFEVLTYRLGEAVM